jgi:aminopeptidase N
MGRRALKNLVLGYLTAGRPELGLGLCRVQLERAVSMTDAIAALRLLVDQGGDAGTRALDDFYRRWSHEPLVVDKWLSVQATSRREGTLSRVIELTRHPDFSLRNPNRVRSLIGAFSTANPVAFHAVDGSGYRFLADRITELDPLNPQIAARLLRGLIRWRRYDPVRQRLMRAELERILRLDQLSSDVYELVSKALDGA